MGILASAGTLSGCSGDGSPASLSGAGLNPAGLSSLTKLTPAWMTQSLRERISIAVAPLPEVHARPHKTWASPDQIQT